MSAPVLEPLASEMPGGGFKVAGHLGSHRALVPWARERFLPGVVGPSVDVVAVPAARQADGVGEAARVARKIDALLVILASRETVPDRARQVAERWLPADRVVVVTQRGRWHIPGLLMTADILPMSRLRDSDTAAKRNVALALSRICGWRRLLFMDDDVWGFGAPELETVRRALADSTDLEAVGWTFDNFPDNSMVCHAYRRAGGEQSTFIGGGALAVRVHARTPHFPLVYNEDWLFMLPMMLRRRVTLARGGSLTQERFDPFQLPGNAVKQEFGDVLGEGLFRMRHLGMDVSVAQTRGYWRVVLDIRRALIEETAVELRRLLARGRTTPDLARAASALDAARGLYGRPIVQGDGATIAWSDALACWVVAWRQDALAWSNYLGALEPGRGLDAAIRKLRLTRHVANGTS